MFETLRDDFLDGAGLPQNCLIHRKDFPIEAHQVPDWKLRGFMTEFGEYAGTQTRENSALDASANTVYDISVFSSITFNHKPFTVSA